MAVLSNVKRLTDNLILIPLPEAQQADPTMILDGDRYSCFRGCPEGSIFIRKHAAALSQGDIETLNKMCDAKERPMNKRVKKLFARSLKDYFGEMAFHVNEIGCGRFPLIRHFDQTAESQVSYQGIERDRGYIAELHQMDIPATDWPNVMNQPVPQDKPVICVAVYALHFLVDNRLAKRIARLSNDTGFFVGNFYSDPAERDSHTQRTKLTRVLDDGHMSYIRLQDPRSRTNEFWIISQSGNVGNIHRYAQVLQDKITPPSAPSPPAP